MSAADRELLELAAKAAGMHPDSWGWDGLGLREYAVSGVPHCGFSGPLWNPLEDDGDALRLAVKLEMNVTREKDQETGFLDTVVISHFEIRNVEEPEGDDHYAATRRAIVRAAAEIGRVAA